MVNGHRSDWSSVARSLGDGDAYSSLGDCTIWLPRPLSPQSVPALLGHCPACCDWVFLAQQAVLKWCEEDSWHKSGTVPHGHFSYRNPRIRLRHAKSQAAAAPQPCFLFHDRTVLSTYFLSQRTKQSSALAEQLSSLEIKHSRLLASISNLMSRWD